MLLKGMAHVYGDDVNTDVIIPARYLNTSDPAELAAHCMEDLDKGFVQRVKKGDMVVAGKNFGCGSSREQAAIALREATSTFRPSPCHRPNAPARIPLSAPAHRRRKAPVVIS